MISSHPSLKLVFLFGLFTSCQSTDNPQQPTPAKPITVTGIAQAIDGRLSPNTPIILELYTNFPFS
jgi:hypothetical protein